MVVLVLRSPRPKSDNLEQAEDAKPLEAKKEQLENVDEDNAKRQAPALFKVANSQRHDTHRL